MPAEIDVDQTSAAASRSLEDRPPRIVTLALILLPILFNAIALLPEATHTTPSGNDQVFHYLFIERANQATSAGDNPFDHWLPELELGFPQFLYYQNLPHLMVVGLYRLLFEQISLIRLLNVFRYLLMVTFPLTVYWSLRKMEFSPIAAAVGAALSPMLSSNARYGFDFRSYTWSGSGMFPQLCAMHLMFLGSACVRRVLERGRGFVLAILVSSGLLLSDLLYGYIFGLLVAILWLLNAAEVIGPKRNLGEVLPAMSLSTLRLAMIFVPVGLITAYQTVPFFVQIQYVNQTFPPNYHAQVLIPSDQPGPSPNTTSYPDLIRQLTLEPMKIFFGGQFFDDHRLPAITFLVILGIAYGAMTRREEARIALAMLIFWMVLTVPNPVSLEVTSLIPSLETIPSFRLISGVDFAAILTAALGGECIWKWYRLRSSSIRLVAPIALLCVLYLPLAIERWTYYQVDARGMEVVDQALRDDLDLRTILTALKKLPPGRVYAGTRDNWGSWMNVGGIHLYDLLPVEQLDTVMPWQTLSLNAPLLWQLDVPSSELCRLFNIRYIIAPPALPIPDSYHPKLSTSNYVLYEIDSGGYLQLGQITQIKPMLFGKDLIQSNRDWMDSPDLAQARFIAYVPPGESHQQGLTTMPNSPSSTGLSTELGTISNEEVTPDSLSARVTVSTASVLIFKVTYHPNWHVTIDGGEQPTVMVSPSYLGVAVAPGHHEVRAEYRSSRLKKMLLLLAGLSLVATIAAGTMGSRGFM